MRGTCSACFMDECTMWTAIPLAPRACSERQSLPVRRDAMRISGRADSHWAWALTSLALNCECLPPATSMLWVCGRGVAPACDTPNGFSTWHDHALFIFLYAYILPLYLYISAFPLGNLISHTILRLVHVGD
jgi:hypothetical protein